MVYDERHYSGGPVLRRVCDQGETADHLPIHDVVVRPTRRLGSLAAQDLVIVAVVRLRRAAFIRDVALCPARIAQRPERTFLFTGLGREVKTDALTGAANEPLRVLRQRIVLRVALVVLVLRIHI